MKVAKNILVLAFLLFSGSVQASDDFSETCPNDEQGQQAAQCHDSAENPVLSLIIRQSNLLASVGMLMLSRQDQWSSYDFEKELKDKKETKKLVTFQENKPSQRLHTLSNCSLLAAVGVQTISCFLGADNGSATAALIFVGGLSASYCSLQLDYAKRKTQNDKASFFAYESYKDKVKSAQKLDQSHNV